METPQNPKTSTPPTSTAERSGFRPGALLVRLAAAPALIPAYTAYGAYIGNRNENGWLRGGLAGLVLATSYVFTGDKLAVEKLEDDLEAK